MERLRGEKAKEEEGEGSTGGDEADAGAVQPRPVVYWGVGDVSPRDVMMASAAKGTPWRSGSPALVILTVSPFP